jgi:hypothetical protein
MSETEIECSLCGRNGGPYVGCPRGCNGRADFAQKRANTLSEENTGRRPREQRYGEDGSVGPKTSDPLWSGAE